jgi:hypothetical protein
MERGTTSEGNLEQQPNHKRHANHHQQPVREKFGNLDDKKKVMEQDNLKKSEVDDTQETLARLSQYSPFIIMFQLLANLLGIFGGIWPSDKNASTLPEERIVEVVDDVVKNASTETAGQKHKTQQPKDIRVGRNWQDIKRHQSKPFDDRQKEVKPRYRERSYGEARTEHRRSANSSRLGPGPPPHPSAAPIQLPRRYPDPFPTTQSVGHNPSAPPRVVDVDPFNPTPVPRRYQPSPPSSYGGW